MGLILDSISGGVKKGNFILCLSRMYHILPYTYQRAAIIGVQVKPSAKLHKKLDVFKNGKLIASVGDTRYKDFPTYVKEKGMEYALKRRELYYMRHKNEGLAGKMALELLW
jgi:hypothetical protein